MGITRGKLKNKSIKKRKRIFSAKFYKGAWCALGQGAVGKFPFSYHHILGILNVISDTIFFSSRKRLPAPQPSPLPYTGGCCKGVPPLIELAGRGFSKSQQLWWRKTQRMLASSLMNSSTSKYFEEEVASWSGPRTHWHFYKNLHGLGDGLRSVLLHLS